MYGYGYGYGYGKFPSVASTPAGPAKPNTQVSDVCPQAMHREGQWSLADYTILREIGSGRASIVYHAICKRSHFPVALKIYRKAQLSNVTRRQVEREMQIHLKLHHEHLLACHAAFEDAKYICMVLEYAAGGDLMKTLMGRGQLSELQASKVVSPLLSVLEYMHGQSILHRDIKPENIVFTRQGVLKLADLGTAIDLREERAVSRLGTLDYMAPEVVRCPDKRMAADYKDRLDLQYSVHADVWSVGILAYELINGIPPFEKEGTKDTMEAIMSVSAHYPSGMSQPAKSFIKRALAKNPETRPYVKQLTKDSFILLGSSPCPDDDLAGVIFPAHLARRQSCSGSSGTMASLCALLTSAPQTAGCTQDFIQPSLLSRTPSAPVPCRPLGRPTTASPSHGCTASGPHTANLSPLSIPSPSSSRGGLPMSPLAPPSNNLSPVLRLGRVASASPSRFATEASRTGVQSGPSSVADIPANSRQAPGLSPLGPSQSTRDLCSFSVVAQALASFNRPSNCSSHSASSTASASALSTSTCVIPTEENAMDTSHASEGTDNGMEVDTSVDLSEDRSESQRQSPRPVASGLKSKGRALSQIEGFGRAKVRRTAPEDLVQGDSGSQVLLLELSAPLLFHSTKICSPETALRRSAAPKRTASCSWSPFSSPPMSPRGLPQLS